MSSPNFGTLLTFVGLILLIGCGLVRREARRRRDASRQRLWQYQQWGSLVAYAVIFGGIMLMMGQK